MKIYNFHVEYTYDDRLHYLLQSKLAIIDYYAEFGIGNPLLVSSDSESTLDRFIRYFKKNSNIVMSKEEKSLIRKILHKCNISIEKNADQFCLLKLLEVNKIRIAELFTESQLETITDESLEAKYHMLEQKLGFPSKMNFLFELKDEQKKHIAQLINSNVRTRTKLSKLIKNYSKKLQLMEDTGVPMIIKYEDIIEEGIFTTNFKESTCYLSEEAVEILQKEGVDIHEFK